jgi:hypothetical protein
MGLRAGIPKLLQRLSKRLSQVIKKSLFDASKLAT